MNTDMRLQKTMTQLRVYIRTCACAHQRLFLLFRVSPDFVGLTYSSGLSKSDAFNKAFSARPEN